MITSLWHNYILGVSILTISAGVLGLALALRLHAKAGASALTVFPQTDLQRRELEK